MLSPLDHYIKEKLRIKYYIRYMDDFILIHESKEYLQECKEKIAEFLSNDGFTLHPKKSTIFAVSKELTFLGFTFKLTDTGKVVKMISTEAVRRKRKKLRHMVAKVKRGELDKHKVDECYKCDRIYLAKGNATKLIQRLDIYYKNLWR